MKRNSLVLVFFFAVVLVLVAQKRQNYKVVEVTFDRKLSSKEYAIGEKVNDIYQKLHDEKGRVLDDVELSAKDQKYLDSVSKEYPIENIGDGDYPWKVYPIGCSWYCGSSYETSVSSSLSSTTTNSYGAEQIVDDDTRTAWVEGVEGYGVGESISFTFNYYAARATRVEIVNGYAKNETTWRNNSRVKKFFIYDDDNLIGEVNLKDFMGWQAFDLPRDFPNRPDSEQRNYISGSDEDRTVVLKFVIGEVYKGDKYDDTAISAIVFDGKDVHCLAKGTQITMSDDETKNIEDVEIGDRVLVINPKGKKSVAQVKHLHKAHHKQITITLENGMKIELTSSHPLVAFSSLDNDKADNVRLVNTDARAGIGSELVVYQDGEFAASPIIKIEKVNNDEAQVYTLELDDHNAFFIANGLLSGQE